MAMDHTVRGALNDDMADDKDWEERLEEADRDLHEY